MAKTTVKDSFGDMSEFPGCGFRTDSEGGTNNLHVYVVETGCLFAAFEEGFWVSAVFEDG